MSRGATACDTAPNTPTFSFYGSTYISASLERLILYLNPTLVLALGAFLFHKKVTRLQILALAVSYCGVLCVFGREMSLQGADVPLGATLVFGSAVSYAVYLSYSGEEVKRLGALRLTGLATSVACLICIVQFLLRARLPRLPWTTQLRQCR